VRVELQPHALVKYGIGLEDVRAALAAANSNSPKGIIEERNQRFQIYANDQARTADQYKPLVIAYRNGAAVRLSDLADVKDSVENLRNQGIAEGAPAVLVLVSREPNANIIDTVDRIHALLPELRASLPRDVEIAVASDRSTTIRASLREVERSLLIAITLVILVVLLFLRNARAAVIPAVAVPVSLMGTFGVMYLAGYSIDNLSLMALTIATSFVMDDAIVVLESISRHVEAGMPPFRAARKGVMEVGFTVLSMSLSLIAVFIPVLLMGGVVGRLFQEFAVTIAIAIVISLALSLTATPMMSAYLLSRRPRPAAGSVWSTFESLRRFYGRSLAWTLRHGALVMLILAGTVCLNVYLFIAIPKGFFPEQDTGRLVGRIRADQGISFQLMRDKLASFTAVLQADPAVDTVVGYTGSSQTNSAVIYAELKPLAKRDASAGEVIDRLRPKLAELPGASLYLSVPQDLHIGGHQGSAGYQYALQADDLAPLQQWAPIVTAALQRRPDLIDVSSDQQDGGLEVDLTVDRDTAARLGLKASQIDNTLYDAFGQRPVSTIYNPLNQYHVVMEVAPQFWQNPDALKDIYVSHSGGAISGSQATNALAGTVTPPAPVPRFTRANLTTPAIEEDVVRNQATNRIANSTRGSTSTGSAVSLSPATMIPLAAISRFTPGHAPVTVNHQGNFVATTISFNLPHGVFLSTATKAIETTMRRLHVPSTIHGGFTGIANAYNQAVANEPMLITAALITVYLVLGILYESYIHPITILSTLPSAGIGALLALIVCRLDFSVMALIGVMLLIGIVKKNGIMMIDVALDIERNRNLTPVAAIHRACMLRLRPILMTTMVALLGALPLALGLGEGAELRRPLGISIAGGLVVSQLLTLYTTPVIYLYLERFRAWSLGFWRHTGSRPRFAERQP
jgi:multidrug efflux pump